MESFDREHEVSITVNEGRIGGFLHLPDDPLGLVIFAHGSGSSRYSPRNQFVAAEMQKRGMGTLLFDLMTPEEEETDLQTAHLRFDILFLASRLLEVTDWIEKNLKQSLPIGYFGSSTGAAAALVAAAVKGRRICSVVSRGGRPDLAGDSLEKVVSSTLLIVGGDDREVLDLNRKAYTRLGVEEKKIEVIAGATHLFEEPGALESVAEIAGNWFFTHFEGI